MSKIRCCDGHTDEGRACPSVEAEYLITYRSMVTLSTETDVVELYACAGCLDQVLSEAINDSKRGVATTARLDGGDFR